jgi:hypothetical protein
MREKTHHCGHTLQNTMRTGMLQLPDSLNILVFAAAMLKVITVEPLRQTSWLLMTLGSYYRGVEARQCLEWSDISDRKTAY